MKKKISLISIAFLTFIINLNLVSAEHSFSNGTITACGFEYMPAKLPTFTSGVFNIVKLLVPVILIVMGIIDFMKAMMANEEKKMKDSQKNFINRLIAAVVIFLIMALVQFVFKKMDMSTSYKYGFVNCINCMLNGDGSSCGAGTKSNKQSSCYTYSISNCSGNEDISGIACEAYENSCRPKCSSFSAASTCAAESHCTWNGPAYGTGGSCSNKN